MSEPVSLATTASLLAAGIGGVLVIASLVGAGLKAGMARGRPHAVIDNLNARIRAWWVITLVGALALALGNAGITLLFAFASGVALHEFTRPVAGTGPLRHARLAAFALVLPLQYVSVWQGWAIAGALLVPGCAAASLLLGRTDDERQQARTLATGLLLCVHCVSYAPAILALTIPGHAGRNALLVVFLVVVVQASDVLQYIWGMLAGRHRIAPRVSPTKTVEGTVGGIASATALGAGLAWATPFSVGEAAAISLAITVLGFAGGLLFSAAKRRRGIKDWGTLIGGHGGMLDRLDSLCLSSPAFYGLLRYGWGAG
jgi:phosphatidate cytidylyltransferase